jgi:hypothetical protein
MLEIGRQSGDPRGGIAIGAVRVEQRADSKAMAAVVVVPTSA